MMAYTAIKGESWRMHDQSLRRRLKMTQRSRWPLRKPALLLIRHMTPLETLYCLISSGDFLPAEIGHTGPQMSAKSSMRVKMNRGGHSLLWGDGSVWVATEH